MDRDSGDFGVDTDVAAEVFAILGNELRLRVLWTLWEANEPAVAFTELRQRVAPDDSGNFTYHLDKLTDHFVRKSADGYALRAAGEHVVRAVHAGTITSAPALPAARIDEQCAYCDAPVEMRYEDEFISVRCTGCGGVVGGNFPYGTFMHYGFPPAGLSGRSREEAVDAAHVLYDSKVTPMMRGVCPECAGRVSVSFDVCEGHRVGDDGLCPTCDARYAVWSVLECSHCKYARRSALWFAAVTHPTVVAYLRDHGLDEPVPFRKITSDNARFVRDITVRVEDVTPYRFRVSIPIDDERLDVTLDETLDVVATERTTRGE